ncbi:hypothetical protein [Actinocorallia longicatena]
MDRPFLLWIEIPPEDLLLPEGAALVRVVKEGLVVVVGEERELKEVPGVLRVSEDRRERPTGR